VPQTLIAGLLIILIGLGAAWHGLSLMRASRSRVPDPGAAPRPPRSPLEMRLRGMTFMTAGLAMVGYGVITPRYSHGGHVTVAPSAPLLDQVIWLLTLACLVSFVALGTLLMAVGWMHTAQNRRARRKAAGDAHW
jgi:hypothetical protein